MITLYGIAASRAFRPLWMLEELGLEYTHVPVDYMGGSRTPEHLERNPNGRIPVLVDADLVLFESMAINLYLAEKYDGGLWPRTHEDRGRTLQWSFWVMTEAELALVEYLFNAAILPPEKRDAAVCEQAALKLAAPMRVLDEALAGREFLVGEHFSVADLNVAAVFAWAQLAHFDLTPYPELGRWLKACSDRPAAQAALRK